MLTEKVFVTTSSIKTRMGKYLVELFDGCGNIELTNWFKVHGKGCFLAACG